MPLLIVDDSESSLLALETAVRGFAGCVVESFTNPLEALARCREVGFDVVLVDYLMPEMNGIEMIRRLRRQPGYEDVPVVMITSQAKRAVRLEALEAGATDFLAKPFDPLELQARVLNLMALHKAQLALADRAKSLDMAFRHATEQADMREQEIIWCLAQAMASRDGNTGDHIERVANIAELIAEGLGLDRIQRRNIYLAAPLHDIGKIAIPDAILQKPGKLERHEIERMREHVPIGVAILANSSAELSRVATAIIAGHHEKWDGTGYPKGLSGDAIPIEARIVAVADVFEALCSDRPYKQAWPIERAYEEIIACSGSHFDPACVAAFRRRWPAIRALFEHGADEDHSMAVSNG
ncbi:HD domain-containing phosphohydrolase [Rhizobium leguminosarum]|uniref:HD domain-containing phosphohydrolase n=1 Tax=Rhizobium leguminosarum TaxID=384 RepID=UPI001030AD61|nr:HD domain-containing phosphohydrolase [Rhizobium leguminosarum]TAV49955.1 response regulator [Rhizobium leguminosarum]TAV59318.1 response regulator [Rhizobium leguminosarum]TAV70365.1 response regulator [Rhizobium leguminosarum]TAV90699.1 response regulator [Rhizobium leguminosarum]TAV95304.1 response regulator [Rhizobium leguminosarum]